MDLSLSQELQILPDFPTTQSAYDTSTNGGKDAFIVKIKPSGSGLIYSTLLGGSNNDGASSLAVDKSGRIYVTGQTTSDNFPTTLNGFDSTYNGGADTFVSKINESGNKLVYSTFMGGSGAECMGYGAPSCTITIDTNGTAFLTGKTRSSDFPITKGAVDMTINGSTDSYVVKLNPNGDSLSYSTFLGGFDSDYSYGIAVDQLDRPMSSG